ncbi:S8 family serine peptidase [Arthrobacter burdickii]|uniref:S8 family serine peptidase n=1 Tax=Arthrobacter burdickii TaxID=3035920 RepID=A0ABT8K536_9MICC|nr:S8 family serine peptidase [Arthrobacter burdickii]MDN4612499.1 S8 family serine peptidase [Arthrobacter burdickii]
MLSRARLAVRAGAAVVVCLAVLLPATPAAADDIRGKEYWLEDYGIEEAWQSTQGEGVTVAVIDSGIDATHPDLAGAVIGGTDASGAGDPGGQRGIGEVPGHGTLVSTLLAGRGHTDPAAPRPSGSGRAPSPTPAPFSQYGNGPDGIVGVAPKANLLAVSLWIEGQSSGPNPAGVSVDEQVPWAVRWAVDNGADVINMSLGSTSTAWPESWDQAFLYAEQHDVVIVAAAGNRAGGLTQVGAPATIPGVLAVAGLDRSGLASAEASSEGISIAVAAPSENLVGGLPGGFYANWSGTSGAAPLVSGVAALIRARYPELTAAQVVNRIVDTARDAGQPGFDTLYGYGVLDVAAAVDADLAVPAENRLGSMAQWIQTYRRGGQPPASAPALPSHPPAEVIPAPPAPQAEDPLTSVHDVPALVVLGFGGLMLAVLLGGALHVARVRRRTPAPSEGNAGRIEHVPGGGNDRW